MKHKLTSGSRLVVASHNKGKVWEINQLLAPYGLLAIAASALNLAEPEETEDTFEGNALIKARAAAQGSGLPALADDSGLEIDALDGAPGVYSANWAGDGKDFAVAMQRVHDELERAGEWKKKIKPTKANFISVLCLCWPDGKHKFFEGKVKGHVVWPPRGGNGFGYDPMFVPKGETQTFGEMEPKAKYAMSHRTRAFEKFKDKFLADLDVIAPLDGPNAERDASGLMAAAANISTQQELATFVTNLKSEIDKKSNGSGARALPEYLSGLNASLADAKSGDEPAWRTVAKALLAASGIK